MYKNPFSVLVVILNQQEQVLLLQRSDDEEFWQSVTGSMEHGEKALDTAKREVLEETGIDIAALKLNLLDLNLTQQYEIRPEWQHKYPPGESLNTEYAFCLFVPDNIEIKLAPNEHLDFDWCDYNEAMQRLWSESNRRALQFCLPIKE